MNTNYLKKHATRFQRIAILALLVVSSSLTSSCGRRGPDFTVDITGDSKGVKTGTPVTYRGAEAGSVTSIQPSGSTFRVELRLKEGFEHQIRSGATARAVNGLTTQFSPQLVIFPSADEKAAFLKCGDRIPQASGFESILKQSPYSAGGWLFLCVLAGAVLIFVTVIMRGLIKISLVIISVSLPLFLYTAHRSSYRDPDRPTAVDSTQELVNAARNILQSPDTRDVWRASEADVGELLRRARQAGSRESAKQQIVASIVRWKQKVTGQSAKELDALQKLIERFNARDAKYDGVKQREQ